MTTQEQQMQRRQGSPLPSSPFRSSSSSNINKPSSLPSTSIEHELHSLADSINCNIKVDDVVSPIYELLKEDSGEQQESENTDDNKNNRNNVAFPSRKSRYGDRIKAVDALSVGMYVLNASNGLLEYNPNWRQEWTERAGARTRRGGRRRVSPPPASTTRRPRRRRHTMRSTAA